MERLGGVVDDAVRLRAEKLCWWVQGVCWLQKPWSWREGRGYSQSQWRHAAWRSTVSSLELEEIESIAWCHDAPDISSNYDGATQHCVAVFGLNGTELHPLPQFFFSFTIHFFLWWDPVLPFWGNTTSGSQRQEDGKVWRYYGFERWLFQLALKEVVFFGSAASWWKVRCVWKHWPGQPDPAGPVSADPLVSGFPPPVFTWTRCLAATHKKTLAHAWFPRVPLTERPAGLVPSTRCVTSTFVASLLSPKQQIGLLFVFPLRLFRFLWLPPSAHGGLRLKCRGLGISRRKMKDAAFYIWGWRDANSEGHFEQSVENLRVDILSLTTGM